MKRLLGCCVCGGGVGLEDVGSGNEAGRGADVGGKNTEAMDDVNVSHLVT